MKSEHVEVDELLAEGDERLTDLAAKLDGHLEQCAHCRERARGYLRIARWIAEGKALHPAPSGWRERTLARVLATSSTAPTSAGEPSPEVEDPATPRVVAGIDLHRASPPTSSDTTLSASAGACMTQSQALHRRHWSRVVFPIATAAVMLVIASTLLFSGDEAATSLAMRSASPAASPGATPLEAAPSERTPSAPPSQASLPPTQPTAPANDPRANDPQANAPQGAAAPVAIKRSGHRVGVAPPGEGIPDGARTRRGGAVTVDWAHDVDPFESADRADSPRESDILEITRMPRSVKPRGYAVRALSEQASEDQAKLAEAVRAHVQNLKEPVTECVAAHGDAPHGSKIELVIRPDGRSVRVKITPGQIHSSPLGTCISNVFKTGMFPQSETSYMFHVALTRK